MRATAAPAGVTVKAVCVTAPGGAVAVRAARRTDPHPRGRGHGPLLQGSRAGPRRSRVQERAVRAGGFGLQRDR